MINSLRHLFFFIIILFASSSLHAQNSLIDSLKLNLSNLDGTQRISSLLQIAEEISTHDLSSSVKFANEALKLAEISNNQVLQADCRRDLGKYFFLLGRYKKANICFGKALIIYAKEEKESKFVDVYLNIGLLHSREGQLDSATIYYEYSLDWARRNNSVLEEVKALRSLGNVFYKKGQFDEALKYFSKALVLSDINGIGDSELANLYNNLGILFSDWSKYEKSLFYYKKALSIEKALGNLKEQARIYNNLGTIYWYQESLDSALYFYKKSLDGRSTLGDINGKAYVLNNLGMYFGSLNQFDKSLDYFKQSLESFESLKNRRGIVMCLYNIGQVYQEKKDYTIAKKYYKQSLELATRQGFSDYVLANHESLKDIYSELKEWEKAYESLNRYNHLNDSIRKEQNIELLSEMEVRFEKEKKIAELQILEDEMQASKIDKNRTLILIFGIVISLVLIVISTFLLVRQIRNRSDIKYNKLNPALLRYQLNPQFIDSSLTGIKELISKTRVKESSLFLAGLAKLIRVFVETSSSNVIVLEKEIETLQSFLKLHQLRYDYELNFELDIASHIETEMLVVPPFLFFPIYVHVIDNHLSRGTIFTSTEVDTAENYLMIETEFQYYIDAETKEVDEIDINNNVEKIEDRVALLNKTLKDNMYFGFKSTVEERENRKTIFLKLKLPIKPM